MIGGALLVAISGLMSISGISTLAAVMLLSILPVILITLDNRIVNAESKSIG
jgi:DHA1 family bicyclomycin/chloramphenicol resistance-like MFS transporter